MQEVLKFLRASGYKTYIVTGDGQDFVRVYAEQTYGIPSEQVVGTMGGTKFGYDTDGKPFLTKEPKLLLNDNNGGKAEGIHLMIGRRPVAAFGNSTGDNEMLEYTKARNGPLHARKKAQSPPSTSRSSRTPSCSSVPERQTLGCCRISRRASRWTPRIIRTSPCCSNSCARRTSTRSMSRPGASSKRKSR